MDKCKIRDILVDNEVRIARLNELTEHSHTWSINSHKWDKLLDELTEYFQWKQMKIEILDKETK